MERSSFSVSSSLRNIFMADATLRWPNIEKVAIRLAAGRLAEAQILNLLQETILGRPSFPLSPEELTRIDFWISSLSESDLRLLTSDGLNRATVAHNAPKYTGELIDLIDFTLMNKIYAHLHAAAFTQLHDPERLIRNEILEILQKGKQTGLTITEIYVWMKIGKPATADIELMVVNLVNTGLVISDAYRASEPVQPLYRRTDRSRTT